MTQLEPEFPAIVLVESETLADCVVLVPLGELADLAAGEDRRVGGLEVVLHNETTIVHEPVLVDDVEDLLVDVPDPRSHQETHVQRDALVFLLHRTVVVLRVSFHVAGDGHCVSALRVFSASVLFALRTLVLVLFDVHSLDGLVLGLDFLDLVVFPHSNTHLLDNLEDLLLDDFVLETVGVRNLEIVLFQLFLHISKRLFLGVAHMGHDEMDSLATHSSLLQEVDHSNGVQGTSINRDVLRFFLSGQ